MKTTRHFLTLMIFIQTSLLCTSQTFIKIEFDKDTFYSFKTNDFFDSTFKKPNLVPNGKWIILSKDNVPIYTFNILNNCINGAYSEYLCGILRLKGFYRMDSLWTFRFNPKDDRFKDSVWILNMGIVYDTIKKKFCGFEFTYKEIYNKWYTNGTREYERHGEHFEIWYYPTATIKKTITNFENDKEEIKIEQSFDSIGQLNKIITTRKNQISHNLKERGKFLSSDTIEYNGVWKIKETIIDQNNITTILYGEVGQEIKRIKERKKTKK
jgi:hypothetical protein